MGSNLYQVARRGGVGGSWPWQQLPGAPSLRLRRLPPILGAARAALPLSNSWTLEQFAGNRCKTTPHPTNLGGRPISRVLFPVVASLLVDGIPVLAGEEKTDHAAPTNEHSLWRVLAPKQLFSARLGAGAADVSRPQVPC